MYCTSETFMNRMQAYIDEIEEKSNGVFIFVEYIPLPYFGNTILRFDIAKENYTLEELDAYEASVQDIVKDEFLVDFMGSVYQKVGLAPWMYEEKFKRCYYKYKNVPIVPCRYQEYYMKDAVFLLDQCGLPTNTKIWEIQMEEEMSLFVLGQENCKIGIHTINDNKIHVYEVEEIACIGLMRAVMYAKSRNISLARVLLEA